MPRITDIAVRLAARADVVGDLRAADALDKALQRCAQAAPPMTPNAAQPANPALMQQQLVYLSTQVAKLEKRVQNLETMQGVSASANSSVGLPTADLTFGAGSTTNLTNQPGSTMIAAPGSTTNVSAL